MPEEGEPPFHLGGAAAAETVVGQRTTAGTAAAAMPAAAAAGCIAQCFQAGSWRAPPVPWECESELQVRHLRLLLGFLLDDRLAENSPVVLEGGYVPEMIAAWFRIGQSFALWGDAVEITGDGCRTLRRGENSVSGSWQGGVAQCGPPLEAGINRIDFATQPGGAYYGLGLITDGHRQGGAPH